MTADEYVDPNIIADPAPLFDSDETWHVHDDGGWAWGVACAECRAERPVPQSGPMFNIHHLQRQNALNTTTAEEIKDVLSGVKPEDMHKIDRVR